MDLLCEWMLIGCVYAMLDVSIHWDEFERVTREQHRITRIVTILGILVVSMMIWPYCLIVDWKERGN